MSRNSKSKILNSKQCPNSNSPIPNQNPSARWNLGFGICLGFRVWDLGFLFISVPLRLWGHLITSLPRSGGKFFLSPARRTPRTDDIPGGTAPGPRAEAAARRVPPPATPATGSAPLRAPVRAAPGAPARDRTRRHSAYAPGDAKRHIDGVAPARNAPPVWFRPPALDRRVLRSCTARWPAPVLRDPGWPREVGTRDSRFGIQKTNHLRFPIPDSRFANSEWRFPSIPQTTPAPPPSYAAGPCGGRERRGRRAAVPRRRIRAPRESACRKARQVRASATAEAT